MSSQFLPLEDAAKRVGLTPEKLVDLRSQGKIRGFRDGTSWKFTEGELDRLADDLASDSGAYNPYKGFEDDAEESDEFLTGTSGSGLLVNESDMGSSPGSKRGRTIGGDASDPDLFSEKGSGSDIGLGSESSAPGSSDVNLIAGDSAGSDVKIVTGGVGASDSDDFLISGGSGGLVEIDSGELQLASDEPVISHDSAMLDLAIEPNAGSTGPITDKELKRVAQANPDLMVGKKKAPGDSDIGFDADDDDSGDDLIGVSSDDDAFGSMDSGDAMASMDSMESMDSLDSSDAGSSSAGSRSRGSKASSLELMDDLDLLGGSSTNNALGGRSSRGIDVLSELDLLSADAGGSGLITGDSDNILGSKDLGSGRGKSGSGSALDFDDALADDDDLVMADDEDDLVIGGSRTDVSVSGDSGINLMAPSDSGLSLESEPLDLAGSSISALDLGAELGMGSGSAISGKMSSPARSGRGSELSIEGDEDFRLSPSGVGFEAEADSNSQVIEIEESEAFEEDAFGGDAFGDGGFNEGGFDEAQPVEAGFDDGGGIDAATMTDGIDDEAVTVPRGRAGFAAVYEVPFSIFQVGVLAMTLCIMCLGGMLMTDLMRNMWAYTDTAAPVSSLTDSLISLANLDG